MVLNVIKQIKIAILFKCFFFPVVSSFLTLILTNQLITFNQGKELFLLFLLSTIVSAWFGGYIAGIISTITSIILAYYYLFEPIHHFKVINVEEIITIIIFIILTTLMIVMINIINNSKDRSQNTFRSLLESINYGFLIIDIEFNVRQTNLEMEKILNKSKSNILNKKLFDLIPELFQTELYYNLKDFNKKKAVLSLDIYLDSVKKWFRINAFPYSNNKRLGLYFKDITETKEQEKNYRKTQLYFDKIFESNIIGLVFSYSNGKILSANDAFLKMIGYTDKDIENRELTWDKITLEKHKYIDEQINNQILQSGVSNIYEKEYLTKTRNLVPVIMGVSMIDPKDNLCLSFILNIKDRKNIQQKLKESEEKFRTLVNSMNDIVILLNKDKNYIDVYGQWLKNYNVNDSTYLNEIVKELSLNTNIDLHSKHYDIALEGKNVMYEWVAEYNGINKIYFQNSVSPIYGIDNSINGLVIVARDITELKNVQTNLNESNDKVNIILESITDAFITLDTNWKFTYVNKKAEEYFQTKRENLLNKRIWDVFPYLIGSKTYDQYRKSFELQQAISFEDCYLPTGHWFDIHLYPNKNGLTIYHTDINERKKYEDKVKELLADIDSNKKRLDNIISNIPGCCMGNVEARRRK